jgi:uridine kinase
MMIIEGILILANPELGYWRKIFVHADSDERLIRRLKRDVADRGRDMDEVLTRYQNTKTNASAVYRTYKAFLDIIT